MFVILKEIYIKKNPENNFKIYEFPEKRHKRIRRDEGCLSATFAGFTLVSLTFIINFHRSNSRFSRGRSNRCY